MKRSNKGFTLTELLVVIVILGIIAGISIPLIRNLSTTFEKRKYQNYSDSVLAASKLYNDSYSEDLFGHKEYGCAYITYSQLLEKNLIKDIEIEGVSCNHANTYVRVIKQKDKYGYSNFLGCGKEKDGKADTLDISLPSGATIPAMDENSCTGTSDNNLLITADTTNVGDVFNKKRKTTSLTIASGTGINKTVVIYTAWSTSPNDYTGNHTWSKATFKVSGNQEKQLLDGNIITSTSNEIVTPENANGKYYLLVRVDNLQDLYGSKWKNPDNSGDKYISFGPFSVDNEKPTIKVDVYKCNSSNEKTGNVLATKTVNSSGTLSLANIAGNVSGWLNNNLMPYGVCFDFSLNDNLSLKSSLWQWNTTGLSENQSGYKDLNGGESLTPYTSGASKNRLTYIKGDGHRYAKLTLKDGAGNTTSINLDLKLDITAPNKPTVKGYIKPNSTNVTKLSDLNNPGTVNTNTWTKNYLYVVASGSTDSMSNTKYYLTTTGQTDDVTNSEQSARNVNVEGSVTLKYKACDAVNNCSEEAQYISKQDRTAPTVPTVIGYKRNDSTEVTSTSGLSTIATNTWYKGWVIIEASGSSDSGVGGIKYLLTTTGANTNVTDIERTYRNVNAQGESTISFKACDSLNNCSSTKSFVAKLDRTAPTAPTVKGYKKPDDADYSSSSGMSTLASNTWHKGYAFVEASGSSDSGVGGVKYLLTTTGANTNVTDIERTYRNVNAQGESTISFKACDSLNNCSSSSDFITKLDRTAPTAPTVTGYVKPSSDNVSSTTGLTTKVTSGTWTKDYLYVAASGSTDDGAKGIKYYLTTSGQSSDVTDSQQSGRNVNTTAIIKYKACDSLNNCSSYTTYESKQDRTAPNKPTVKGYKKPTDADVSSTSGLEAIATNTWYSGYVVIEASGSSDSGVGGVKYLLTTTGANTNVTDIERTLRNINAQGESTVSFKACDSLNNCSSSTSFVAKLDRTAPTCSTSKTSTGSQSGVSLSISCSDAHSGCSSSNKTSDSGVTGNKTYTVKDNAANSGTCTVSVSGYDCNGYNCGSGYQCNCTTKHAMLHTDVSARTCTENYSKYDWKNGHVKKKSDGTYYCEIATSGDTGQGCCWYNYQSCSTCYNTCYHTCYK